MSLLIALVLAVALVASPDALRFELIRALRAQPDRLLPVVISRFVATTVLALLLAWLLFHWAASNPAGPAMVVFSGVMTALWLWTRFWTRTFIADPDHPLFRTTSSAIVLATVLSVTLWLALFTHTALLLAWTGASVWLFVLALIWPLADALILIWGSRSPRAGEWLVQESTQQRWGRGLGLLLVLIAFWAIWAVLAQG
ncbi:hypothetical protein BGP77_10180 [Saccharospirillum sp. MSK14-1]|uniref:hypothetical protein n=1 Tax=Saccharospirillum sp. MSK14-1 TaxID=1897632 RepID=UPI000D368FB2|nr:hypothetical protein [Saccharospirillum sp. MSK14-1]PTY38817.1 hypothetical protein BGP77_10180 [Saccharospirillum sp. MSK14-1]